MMSVMSLRSLGFRGGSETIELCTYARADTLSARPAFVSRSLVDNRALLHNGENLTTLMPYRKHAKSKSERLTISLGDGQRAALEAIARANQTSVAFVVRYGLNRFIAEQKDKQLRLDFPG